MPKYCLKKTSKRVSCAKRYKIEKKVKEHNRKVKKSSKKDGIKRKKVEKVTSVPKSCPFKEEILAQAEQEREKIKSRREAQREASKAVKVLGKRPAPSNLEQLAAKASEQADNYAKNSPLISDTKLNTLDDKSIKAFASEVRETIKTADVVIQVLDARDPLGSRSASVEEQVVKSGKRLVLLLNKIDLVPRENVRQWLLYLRREFPAIAFKASTQDQKGDLGRFANSSLANSNTAKCIGADLIMQLLANYCRNKDIKTSIRVGIVGFPNVGKSSVINSLKRKRVCNVGALPGITKEVQEIELDKHIRLLDSPGVVLLSNKELDPIEVALKNVVRVDSLMDPVAPVVAILRRCSKEMLMLHYTIADFKSCDQFLSLIARKLGRLKKGARPDTNAAARHVLHDWNSGRLRYYTQPPESERKFHAFPAELVTEFSAEFDIDSLEGHHNELLKESPLELGPSVTLSDQLTNDCKSDLEAEGHEIMDTDNDHDNIVVTSGRKIKLSKKDIDDQDDENQTIPEDLTITGNVQLNRKIKKAVKNRKKKLAKLDKKAEKLADKMDFSIC